MGWAGVVGGGGGGGGGVGAGAQHLRPSHHMIDEVCYTGNRFSSAG